MHIRAERPEDFEEIDELVRAAFGGEDEVKIVRAIRASQHYVPELSLVAIDDDNLVGHIMLSYALLGPRRVLQLAPLAVTPARQRQGIGDVLTREAIKQADSKGEPLVLVLGHPEYYPRFGFEPARALGLEPSIPELPDEVWMVKKLNAYDPSIRGTAIFPPSDVT